LPRTALPRHDAALPRAHKVALPRAAALSRDSRDTRTRAHVTRARTPINIEIQLPVVIADYRLGCILKETLFKQDS